MNKSAFAALTVSCVVVSALIVVAADPPAASSRAPFSGRKTPRTATRSPKGAGLVIPTAPRARSELPDAVRQQRLEPPMDVVPIDRDRRPAVDAEAAAIDALIDGALGREARASREPLDDSLFVRRAYLALGGRIPTLAETVTFLASKDQDKRTTLVDDLLESPDWVSHFFNAWAGTLRLVDAAHNVPGIEAFDSYSGWVKEAIASNRPYDEWVREMLTANGKIWTNPAVGYQLRDYTMPFPYVDNTLRVFLGTRIGCAECHDHPSEPWTRRNFYEIASFTAGMEGRADGKRAAFTNQQAIAQELGKRLGTSGGKKLDPVAGAFWVRHLIEVREEGRVLRLPGVDGGAAEPVDARVPWGEVPESARSLDRRSQFAAWITDAGNRQFARTIANRLWKFCFGVGLVEPIDDFRDSNPASHPELLDHLADLVIDLGFDQREFVRVIVSTEAWRQRAVSWDPADGEPFRFAAPLMRRMAPEQVWDSLLTLVCRDAWAYQRPTPESLAWITEFDFADGPRFEDAYALYDRYLRLREEMRSDQYGRCGYRKRLPLVRASELPAPADSFHPVRLFGQGDRLTIDGARSAATLPQVLMLWKSDPMDAVADEGSAVMETIAANDPAMAMEIIFLSVLARRPHESDRALIGPLLDKSPRKLDAWRDVLWSLLNTREFLFVQ